MEPTNIANVPIQNGIDTINEFFTEELAKKIQFKFNDILAALVMVQLEKLPDRLEKAKNDFQLYFDGMKSIKHIHFFKTDIENGTVPLWVDALVDGDRDVFIKNMRKKYRMSPILPSIHLQDVYSKEEKLHLPSSEKIADKGLWFPSGAGKGREDIERVIQATKEFFE